MTAQGERLHHVGNVDFGVGVTPYATDSPIRDVYMYATVEDEFMANLLLTEQYDQTYGIFDHQSFGDIEQLTHFAMHPAEDCITGSRLERTLREVIACRLPELTNTPLMELMTYPRFFLDKLLEDAKKAKVKEDKTTEELEHQLNLGRSS